MTSKFLFHKQHTVRVLSLILNERSTLEEGMSDTPCTKRMEPQRSYIHYYEFSFEKKREVTLQTRLSKLSEDNGNFVFQISKLSTQNKEKD